MFQITGLVCESEVGGLFSDVATDDSDVYSIFPTQTSNNPTFTSLFPTWTTKYKKQTLKSLLFTIQPILFCWYDCTFVFFKDEVLDFFRMKDFYKRFDASFIFVTFTNSNNVYVWRIAFFDSNAIF